MQAITENCMESTQLKKVFENRSLLPHSWKDSMSTSELRSLRVTNPTIVNGDRGIAMCYRVIYDKLCMDNVSGTETETVRLIATCLLDSNFEVVEDSIEPLSDHITFAEMKNESSLQKYASISPRDYSSYAQSEYDLEFAGKNLRAYSWHADPRYFVINGEIYLSWNDGANKPRNNQFLVKMTADGLLPAQNAKEIVSDIRSPLEKNWLFFNVGDSVKCVYSVSPHVILDVDFSDETKVLCRKSKEVLWEDPLQELYGERRGGPQPIELTEGKYLSLSHSSYRLPEGLTYAAAPYIFNHEGVPEKVSEKPFKLDNPFGNNYMLEKLNAQVANVVYPTGNIRVNDNIIISYGINDEHCAIGSVSVESLVNELTFAVSEKQEKEILRDLSNSFTNENCTLEYGGAKSVPLYWWQAKGKMLSSPVDKSKFFVGNFGDEAAHEIFSKLTGVKSRIALAQEQKFITIGSVLQKAKEGDVIWGAGIKDPNFELSECSKKIKVFAVRGPLTLNYLYRAGVDISRVKHVFDPGCLVGYLYKELFDHSVETSNEKYGDIRIIPHFRDQLYMRRMYPEYQKSFVYVDKSTEQMVQALAGAKAVYSSSLHGIIFAEAFGIPAYWLAPLGGEPDFKFFDYYYGTGRYNVKRFDSLEEAMREEPMELPVFDFEAYLKTFPYAELDQLQNTPTIKLGETVKTSDSKKFDSLVQRSDQGRFGRLFWQTARNCLYKFRVNCTEKFVTLRIIVSRAQENWDASTSTLKVSGPDGSYSEVHLKSDASSAVVELSLRVENNSITFNMDIEKLSRAMKIPGESKSVRFAFCIHEIAIY